MIIADKLNKYRDYYVPASALPQRTSAPNLRAEAAAACDSTPCGLCVDVGIAILISKPQRMFGPLADRPPVINEVLTIPLYDGGRMPMGTLWAAHHDSNAHFDSNDLRILEALAAHLVLALKLQEQVRDHAAALAVLESHQWAQQNLLSYDLYEERSMREQAEIESRQTARFKDAVIDEMNHRTKNTLQVASNLLTMQARASSSAQVREALQDSAVRLHVLAKVHELLYADADSTHTVLMPELLKSLADALRQSCGPAFPRVTLEIACDPMALPAQQAVALALLANEAITNAYKHAFASGAAGRIELRLQRLSENALSLWIEDTGSGLVAPPVEGMGLRLIRTFAAQLGGVLAVTNRNDVSGTSITLSVAAPVVRPSRL